MKRKIGYALLLLAMAGVGHAIGYGTEMASRKYSGRSLVRRILNKPCTPCEKAAMERLASSSKGEKS